MAENNIFLLPQQGVAATGGLSTVLTINQEWDRLTFFEYNYHILLSFCASFQSLLIQTSPAALTQTQQSG